MQAEWQAIDTAPRDGTEIIAYCECGDYWLIRWFPSDKENSELLARYGATCRGAWCAGKDVGEAVVIPCLSLWQPLPAPPPAAPIEGGTK